jgi:hypothetical protein
MTTWKASFVAIPLGLLFAAAMAQVPAPPPSAQTSARDAASKPQPARTSESTTVAKPAEGEKEKKAKKE